MELHGIKNLSHNVYIAKSNSYTLHFRVWLEVRVFPFLPNKPFLHGKFPNTAPLRCKLTNKCKWLASLAASHVSIQHLACEYMRVIHCLHISWNSRALNSRMFSCVLALTSKENASTELTSTRKRTRQYSQSNSPVLAITRMSENFCRSVMH